MGIASQFKHLKEVFLHTLSRAHPKNDLMDFCQSLTKLKLALVRLIGTF